MTSIIVLVGAASRPLSPRVDWGGSSGDPPYHMVSKRANRLATQPQQHVTHTKQHSLNMFIA